MKVLVEVYATLYDKLGWRSKEVNFNSNEVSLEDLIKSIPDLYNTLINDLGDLTELINNYIVFINGIHAQFKNGLKTVLRDGDKVAIFPPVAGG